jgi:hypothetical protein
VKVAALIKLQSVFVGSLILLSIAVVPYAFSQTQIIGGAKERQPSYGELENFRILSYSDLDGWDQAAEFRVSRDGRYAYTSNYQGASIVDVSNPEKPRVISRIKNDPSVQSQYIDVLENLLVINQEGVRAEGIKTWDSGIRLFDIKDPAKPREAALEVGAEQVMNKISQCNIRVSMKTNVDPVLDRGDATIAQRLRRLAAAHLNVRQEHS